MQRKGKAKPGGQADAGDPAAGGDADGRDGPEPTREAIADILKQKLGERIESQSPEAASASAMTKTQRRQPAAQVAKAEHREEETRPREERTRSREEQTRPREEQAGQCEEQARPREEQAGQCEGASRPVIQGRLDSHRAARGIAFTAELLEAVYAGRKTQTRRPMYSDEPPFVVGERVYIREKYARHGGEFIYPPIRVPGVRWIAGRFMPREAARRFIRIDGVEAASLHDISPADAVAEGMPEGLLIADSLAWFRGAWDAIYGSAEHAWAKNPKVWVIQFTPVEPPR